MFSYLSLTEPVSLNLLTNLNIVFFEINGLLGYLRLNFRLVVATDHWISTGLTARAWLGTRRVGGSGREANLRDRISQKHCIKTYFMRRLSRKNKSMEDIISPFQFNNECIYAWIKHSKSSRVSILNTYFNGKTNKRYGHTAHTFSRLLSDILISERCISISSRFQLTDNNTFLAVSPADLIT